MAVMVVTGPEAPMAPTASAEERVLMAATVAMGMGMAAMAESPAVLQRVATVVMAVIGVMETGMAMDMREKQVVHLP